MKKFLFVAIASCILSSSLFAQSVAINASGATANASSILDVQSTTKGMLIPRMTKAQKNAIATPAIGLLVYQAVPDSIGFHYYSGSQWIWLNPAGAASNDWSLTGNTGTDTAVNFIGTIDNMPLRFKQDNEWLGQWNKNTGNYFIGEVAGKKITTGQNNIGIGDSVLNSVTTGSRNTAVGSLALTKITTFTDNTAMGYNVMNKATLAQFNTGVGSRTLEALTTGDINTALGANALLNNTTGGLNTAIGVQALEGNISGLQNVAIGVQAMLTNSAGLRNTALGFAPLFSNTTGSDNIAVGPFSLFYNQTGNKNIAVGHSALEGNINGTQNIAIGDSAIVSNVSSSNLIAIGRRTLHNVTASSNLIAVGDSALYSNTTGNKNIAIGNSALVKNTTGILNTAIGNNALKANQTGSSNIAIGDSALSANTTNWNIAIGKNALLETTTGDKNIAIGDAALSNNATGVNNVAIGYASQLATNTNNRNNTSLGFRTAFSMQGYSNTVIGGDAMGKPAVSYTVNNTVAVGDSTLFNIQTGADFNTAVGSKTLFSNTTGTRNVALGNRSLYTNTTGNDNVGIADSALFFNNNGIANIGIGKNTLKSNVDGNSNVAIGFESLENNISGTQNIAIGYKAMPNNTFGTNNTAMGFFSLKDNTTGEQNVGYGLYSLYNNITGDQNTGIGVRAGMGNTTGSNNTFVGYYSGNVIGNSNVSIGANSMTSASVSSLSTVHNMVSIGDSAMFSLQTGAKENTAIGSKSLFSNTTGSRNTAIGFRSMYDNTFGTANTIIGDSALYNNTSGGSNVIIGNSALFTASNSSFNTAIGFEAGRNGTGSGNVYLGYQAGKFETGSNKLYIDNSNTAAPLIFGDFATNLVRVNGTLNINNQYSLPIADGAPNQILYTNGAGVVSWVTATSESTTANNGLTLTGSNVALGGTLLNNTSITHGNFNVQHFLSGTGDFLITTPSTNAFTVLSTGNTGINTTTPTHRLHLVNTISGVANNYANGMFIQNTNATAGQATLAFKNSVLPGNRAWITGMNAFDNYVIAYGDSLTGSTTIVRVDTAGYVGINPLGLPSSRLDVVGSFGTAIRTTTVNTTLGVDDHTVIIGTAAGAISVTLPAASTCDRRVYIIVNRSGSNQTVTSYLDFAGSATNIAANSAITVQSNGTNWFRIQ